MVGVATPVAMAMQAATEDNEIPVVFAAVSDPVSTGLVESMEEPLSLIHIYRRMDYDLQKS